MLQHLMGWGTGGVWEGGRDASWQLSCRERNGCGTGEGERVHGVTELEEGCQGAEQLSMGVLRFVCVCVWGGGCYRQDDGGD
mgnify:CR=1 FL=1